MTVSKNDLLNLSFGIEDFDWPGVGTVRIRPLTRAEAVEVQGKDIPMIELEKLFLSKALVEPKMTEADVSQFLNQVAAGTVQPLVERIAEISGMKAERPKEAVKQFRSEA